MKRTFSLKARIIVITTALVGLTLCVMIFLVSRLAANAEHDAVAQAKTRTDELLNQTIRRRANEAELVARLIADESGTRSVLQADFPTTSDYLDSIVKKCKLDWMVIVDSQGKLLGRSSHASQKADFSKSPGLEQALARNPWKGATGDQEQADVRATAPIVVGDYVQGAVIVGYDIDQSFLSQLGNMAGVDLTSESSKENSSGGDSISWKTPVKSGSGSSSLAFNASLLRERAVGFLAPLKSALGFLALFALAGAVVAALSVAYSVTRPIQALVSSAQLVQRGLWPAPFNARRRDEIGVLQNTFDQMTTELQANHARLAAMLQIDPLTELLNHRIFREGLDRLLGEGPVGVIVLNIDGFEEYNRVRGVIEADILLQRVASVLRELLPESSLIGRHSGDEFIATVPAGHALEFAEGLREEIERSLGVTVSVGCASLSEAIDSTDLLILAAGMAVRQAKVAGRNRVRALDSLQSHDPESLRQMLSNASYSAVLALAEAVDAKDEYTRGHSRRVAEYARDLARHCGYDAGFVELVYVTGTLHDVGKIGVPDAILKKQARLTDEEHELVKEHPAAGEKIVSQIPQLADTLPGIRGHHERFDGKGYPDGLAGDDIPLVARILAIADTYDAMTSDRPYRKGLAESVAIDELVKGAGTQFDPDFALAFKELRQAREQLPPAA